MLVRSGREPPVLWVAGIRAVVLSWSVDGKMLGRGQTGRMSLGPGAAGYRGRGRGPQGIEEGSPTGLGCVRGQGFSRYASWGP